MHPIYVYKQSVGYNSLVRSLLDWILDKYKTNKATNRSKPYLRLDSSKQISKYMRLLFRSLLL